MNSHKSSKIPVKPAKSKHVDKKRLLKTFGLLLSLIGIVAFGVLIFFGGVFLK